MGFLGIGAMEALVVVVIALIIFGPGRLPEIMGEAGRTVRDFRRATRELTGDFEESISEVRGTYRELENEMRSTATGLRKDVQTISDDLNSTVAEASKLDGSPRSAPRARSRSPKLDQVDEPGSSRARDFPEYVSAGSANADSQANRQSPVRRSPNGASEPVDDLLSDTDADDLLSAGEPD